MAKVVYQNSSSFVPSRNIPVGIVGYEETDKGLAVKGVDMKEKPDQNGNRTPRLFYFEKNQQTGSTPAAYAQNILTPEKLKNGYKAFGKT